jgi:glycosyltransferase involved in cell wall biosynthesis
MKVFQLHRHDQVNSGAAVAMHRLHAALRAAAVNSTILCGHRRDTNVDAVQMPRWPRAEALLRPFTRRLGLNDLHGVSAFRLAHSALLREADVLHIHGIHSGYFSFLALPAITRTVPTVFTLHDLWALTGHCAASYECGRWRVGCGRCPDLKANPAVRRDATHLEWRLKRRTFRRSRMVVVAPSRWLQREAEEGILGHLPVHHIPHGVDTETYRPRGREQCRELLGIPPGVRVLLFTAMALPERGKGFDLLRRSLEGMPEEVKRRLLLMIMGSNGEAIGPVRGIATRYLGRLTDEDLKAVAYSAADLLVSPTRGEAFGLTLLESLACGTPVVVFRAGGVTDVVRDGVGYLAQPGDPDDLRKGVLELLANDARRAEMGAAGRALAAGEFSMELCVQRHIELYRELCAAAARGAQDAIRASGAARGMSGKAMP